MRQPVDAPVETPEPKLISASIPSTIPLLCDPRFEHKAEYDHMQVQNRAYVIIARFNNREAEILLKIRGAEGEFPHCSELPGGVISAEQAFEEYLIQMVECQVGSKITELKQFGNKLWQLANDNSNYVDCATLFLAEASPKSGGGVFTHNSTGYGWYTKANLKGAKVVNLDETLEAEKSGRMGLMILAGLDYSNSLI